MRHNGGPRRPVAIISAFRVHPTHCLFKREELARGNNLSDGLSHDVQSGRRSLQVEVPAYSRG